MVRAICRGVVLLSLLVSAEAWAGGMFTVVINEVDYDQAITDTAEFIELKNVGTIGGDFLDYQIEIVSGTGAGDTAADTITLPSFMLYPGEYYVDCGDAANNGLSNDEADCTARADNGAFCDGDESCLPCESVSAGDPCDSDSFPDKN